MTCYAFEMAWKLDIAGHPRFDPSTTKNIRAFMYDSSKTDAARFRYNLEITVLGAVKL